MTSTLVGQSGRKYIQGNVLKHHPKKPELSVYQAHCGSQSFVFKRVSESFFRLSLDLKREFAGTRRLRMHTDYNEKECALVYEYFRYTLLSLLKEYPDFPVAAIKEILRYTGEAVKELHDKNWIHIDVKPDNILVDWTSDKQGKPIVKRVALGDFDIALKLKGEKPLRAPHAVGNVFWRSPEGQTGKGVAKPSDVFSFGLVCIYALGGAQALLLEDYKELEQNNIRLEQEVLVRHFLYFGPLPEGLLKQVNDEAWCNALRIAAEMSEAVASNDPGVRFKQWPEDLAPNLGPEAKGMISGMTNLDPAARATIDEILEHPWW